MEEILSLEETRDKLQEVKKQMNDLVKNIREGLATLDQATKDIDELYPTTDDKGKEELRNYKSSVLQIKSDYGLQLQYIQPQLNGIDQVISLLDKAIKINSGDIF